MRPEIFTLLGALAIFNLGCTTPPSTPAALLKMDEGTSGMRAVDFPAERRGTWIAPQKDGSTRVCSEPPMDVGINTNQLLSLAAELKKSGVGASGSMDRSLATSIVELKGRTPAVLALRDVMYRMCEARISGGNLTADETIIYKEIVSVILNFSKADLANAQEKQEISSQQASRNLAFARQMEIDGFQALEKKDWKSAQKAFEESEAAYNGYGWSYEYARSLKAGGSDKEQAQRILNIKGRMPLSTRATLEEIK